MKQGNERITGPEHLFVLLWGIAIAVVFIGLGIYTVTTINQYREDAIIRHNARIDPFATEPGRTAADDTLPAGANPRKVTVGLYMEGIASISILEASWNPVFYIWFRWVGDDINPGETFKLMEGEVLSKEKLNEQVVNGEHYALYLVKAQVTKFFTTDRFPVDDHLLTIAIEDSKLPWTQLEYVPDTENTNISSRVKMPGYKIYRTGLVMKPHTYKSNFGDLSSLDESRKTYSQLIYGIWNSRPGLGTYSKIFVGLFAAMAIAMLAFFIKPTDVDPRFGLGVGGFFGAVANTFVAASLVPDSGIITLMDMVNGVGMVAIFLTLVQSTISLYTYDILGKEALSKQFDRVSFVVFALGIVIVNILIPLAGQIN